MEKYSPEQIAEIDRKDKETREKADRWLTEKMSALGLSEAGDIAELDLSTDEQKQMRWTHWYEAGSDAYEVHGGNPRCFVGKREDGAAVKVLVKNVSHGRMLFAADIFSPSGYEGHGGNHDFSDHELEQNLKLALTGPVYPEKKSAS